VFELLTWPVQPRGDDDVMMRDGKIYDCEEEEMDNVMRLTPAALAHLQADEDGTAPLDPHTALRRPLLR
jgi:hypothetical protein